MLPVGDQVLPGGGRGGGGDSATLSAAMPMTLLYNQSLRKPNRCLLVGEMSTKMKYFLPLYDNLKDCPKCPQFQTVLHKS